MKKDQGNCRNAVLRLDSSVTQPYNFTDKLLPLVGEDSRLKTSLQISVLELQNSEGLFPMHSLAQQFFLSNFQRVLAVVHLEQEGLQKRVLMYEMSSVCQAASKNRG